MDTTREEPDFHVKMSKKCKQVDSVFAGEENNTQQIPLSFKYLLNVIVKGIMGK